MRARLFGDSISINYFLKHFPEYEFWRFFVERERYDQRDSLCIRFYSALFNVSQAEAKKLDFSALLAAIKQRTIKDLFDAAFANNNDNLLALLSNQFHLADKPELTIGDFLAKQRGWVGFENNEPGYLAAVTKGMRYLLQSVYQGRSVDLELIQKLHKICTKNVKNMLRQQRGEFRGELVFWRMNVDYDSKQGLQETIEYAQQVEKELGVSGVQFLIERPNGATIVYSSFKGHLAEDVARHIYEFIESGAVVKCVADEGGMVNSHQFLTTISLKRLECYQRAIAVSRNKMDKLKAIFTFLKQIVLHHCFMDGVGRTFSMLLMQFLLMKEGLLPVIFANSNIIPGKSIREMIEEYMRAENEMKRVLVEPMFIETDEFCFFYDRNIKTREVLSHLSSQEKADFKACLKEFQQAKRDFLGITQSEQRKYAFQAI